MLTQADILVYRTVGEYLRGPYFAKILQFDYVSFRATVSLWLSDAPGPMRYEAVLPFWSPYLNKSRPVEFWTLNSIDKFEFDDPCVSDKVFFYSSHSLLQFPCIASIRKLKVNKISNLYVRLPDLTNGDSDFVYAKVKDVPYFNAVRKEIPSRFWSYQPFPFYTNENRMSSRFAMITQRIQD